MDEVGRGGGRGERCVSVVYFSEVPVGFPAYVTAASAVWSVSRATERSWRAAQLEGQQFGPKPTSGPGQVP